MRRFRATVGLLVTAYFARLLVEVPLFSSNQGLLAHSLIENAYPFLWQPLFRPGTSEVAMSAIYLLACFLGLALALGKRSRLCALSLYFMSVCSYRWNFQIVSVDDALINLFLFWLCVLPVEEAHDQDWVSGWGIRLLLGNLSLIYLIAGLSKWTSPMWRQGSALYAVLQLPGSWFAAWWQPGPLWVLLTWAALVLEPALALLPWLKPGPVRRVLATLWVGFHLSVALLMDVALANLLCLSVGWLIFAERRQSTVQVRPRERFAAVVLGLLVCAGLGSLTLDEWRRPGQKTHYYTEGGQGWRKGVNGALWVVGLAQQYRLLDWIDERNYRVEINGVVRPLTLRQGLALTYLTEVCWLPLPEATRVQVCQSSQQRWRKFVGDTYGPAAVRLSRVGSGAPVKLPVFLEVP